MAGKIFISYRREDTAANAIGIGQYLEQEFGRKNIFIDLDMAAGVNFPAVLTRRLSECRVLLALIGPGWVNASNAAGERRLDIRDDWVRLEIGDALKKGVVVIPVLVNGAQLPGRNELPTDIQGLLDQQAASISIGNFRRDMAGLVRDIRAIHVRPRRRGLAWLAAGAALAAASVLGVAITAPNLMQPALSWMKALPNAKLAAHFSSDWVLYNTSLPPYGVGYYFSRSSFKPNSAGSNRAPASFEIVSRHQLLYVADKAQIKNVVQTTTPQARFQDDTLAINCKNGTVINEAATTYDENGTVLTSSKYIEPGTSINWSIADPIPVGTIWSTLRHIGCDGLFDRLLPDRGLDKSRMTLLGPTFANDGHIWYGAVSKTDDPDFAVETLVAIENDADHPGTEFYPNQDIRGLPQAFRVSASVLKFNCRDRKFKWSKVDNYTADGHLVYLNAPDVAQTWDLRQGTPYAALHNRLCNAPKPE